MKIDIPFLTSHAPSLCSPVLCTELEENQRVRLLATGEVKAGRSTICRRYSRIEQRKLF